MVCDTCKMNRLCSELERMEKVPRHEKCRCFIPERPITNADRIRAMTDEELASFISVMSWCRECKAKSIDPAHPCMGLYEGCKGNWLDWLKHEVERSEE